MAAFFMSKYEEFAQTLLRVVVGFLFMTHGGQKLFGWFGAEGPQPLLSEFGIAGILEFVGGLMVMFGLLTGPVAFILAGQMAVAYFWKHVPRGFWPWENGGERAALFCFIFFYLSTVKSGRFSLDALRTAKPESDA